ncbi:MULTISPECIES: SGNH/GDSL hydrolase family protein [Nocardioides]|uniref:SGNH/GDSL hydrolase family protein n=1 Tax=Nocardioides vastitatis TaxID=2568655 RepID=A0ABW0ZEB5_9ACTN|nr:SGNH/GDSL hydrolase family protein [Nocardioides sp.]THJ00235.1 SGNH/GDSL hydrolase family protein [Nocardioides sp.]
MTRHILLGLLALALTTGVSTTIWARAGAGPDHCAGVAERSERRAALVTGEGREVLVIGDSYAVGAGLRLRDSWPVRLPGRVRVDGFSGSGFSRSASACGDVSYAARAPRSLRGGTELVVVEGGLNDTDQPLAEVEAGLVRLVEELRAGGIAPDRVVVVGPPPAPVRLPERVAAVDATLARTSQAHGASYLSMLGVKLTYLDDGLHPDVAGQRVFGDLVAAYLAAHLAAHADRSASVGGTDAARAAG